ncbi:hypothetical protein GCM10010329_79260 [Streptomyces spiroverticillatus]|uniref:Uncharacterized protein n=1 Tax=Streptomyces finlayi TaxID=67296 RepID=A0A919CG87_9ACTN|nr:hypothetical protein GCM10010329_79260 [Streptomyces spiroverticillatus]GHD17948.1 hypothetical protein GCM10010334_80240 [Streptomyces finlayi]
MLGEALHVDGDGGQDVLDVSPGQAAVAAAPRLMVVDELVHRSFDAGAGGVEAPPLVVVRVSTMTCQEFTEVAREEVHSAYGATGHT